MKIFIVALGSLGDNVPFVNIGIELQKRGCEVTVLACDWFKDLICKAGLNFYSILSYEDAEKVSKNPDLWNADKSFEVMANHVYGPATWPVFDFINKQYVPGNTVIIASLFIFGARFAQELLQIPLVTVRLSPFVFWNVDKKQEKIFNHTLKLLLEKICLKRNVNYDQDDPYHWMYSPQKIVGFFPEWFATLQSDCPSNAELTGFPILEESLADELPLNLKTFLDSDDDLVVFTPGTGMRQSADFFRESLHVCLELGTRAIFLTPFKDQIPPDLPKTVKHFQYLPLSGLLPYSSCIVYHGGIGTCAQALKAGTSHLVMPMAFDQFDNGNRLMKLGVGDVLVKNEYKRKTVKEKLTNLLNSNDVKKRCAELKKYSENSNGVSSACDAIIKLLE